MTKLSLTDKLKILLEVTKSSKIFIIVIVSLLFLAYIFTTINKKNLKSSKFTYITIYVIILSSLLFAYRDSLSKMFDYLVNNLFIVIYFPNLAIYLSAILITNIIIWISIFRTKVTKLIKNINIIFYCVMTYILILILNIINVNKLDVFTQSYVYSNKEALALIELSSTIFIIWISFLILYLIIRRFQKDKQEIPVKQEKTNTNRMPKNYKLVEAPYYVKRADDAIKVVKNEAPRTNPYDELLTLNDYKLLLNILKDHKKKEQEEKERLKRQEEEQAKYRQLQELYSSLNK